MNIESLEQRQLMAADVGFDPWTGTLTIEGSDRSDAAIIVQSNSNVVVVTGDGVTQSRHAFSAGQIRSIEFEGRGGNDLFINATHIASRARGDAGNDTLIGGAGNDVLQGGSGNDVVHGQAGIDVIAGETGNDLVTGGDGADVISGGDGNDFLAGGNGDDLVFGDRGTELLFGQLGNDRLVGGDHDDYVEGGLGNDTLWGGSGNDLTLGGAGVDALYGEFGDDRLDGGSDFDYLFGQDGDDVLYDDPLGAYRDYGRGRNYRANWHLLGSRANTQTGLSAVDILASRDFVNALAAERRYAPIANQWVDFYRSDPVLNDSYIWREVGNPQMYRDLNNWRPGQPLPSDLPGSWLFS